jgi:hypothetical protein
MEQSNATCDSMLAPGGKDVRCNDASRSPSMLVSIGLLWAGAQSPRCSQVCHLAAPSVCGMLIRVQRADSPAAPARDSGFKVGRV